MLITVTVQNWSKFNPRSDVKNPSWFRLENTWTIDPEFYDWSAEEKLVWIHLLSMASRKDGVLKVSPDQCSALLRVSVQSVTSCLAKAVAADLITCDEGPSTNGGLPLASRGRNGDVTDTVVTGRDGTERDGTERENSPPGFLFENSSPQADPLAQVDPDEPIPLRTVETNPDGTTVVDVTDEPSSSQTASESTSAPKSRKRKKKASVPKKTATPEDRALAIRWADHHKQMAPKRRPPSVDKFAEGIALIKRNSKFTHQEIELVFEWARRDNFWKDKAIMSPMAAWVKSPSQPTLKKFEVMARQMVSSKDYKLAETMAYAQAYDRGEVRHASEGAAF